MKKLLPLSFALFLAACNSAPQPPAEPVQQGGPSLEQIQQEAAMEANSDSITFLGKSSLIDHEGSFETFEVTVDGATDSDLSAATITVEIDVESITSDSDGLTGHLKRDDFFDVANYPTATFVSTSITPATEPNTYNVVGDLTIKGTTRSIEGFVVVEDGMMQADFLVPRAEFGIGNDSYGEKLLADEIPVEATISLQSDSMMDDMDDMDEMIDEMEEMMKDMDAEMEEMMDDM